MRTRAILAIVGCAATAAGCGSSSTSSSTPSSTLPVAPVRATFTRLQTALEARDVPGVCSLLLGVPGSPVGKTVTPPSQAVLDTEQRGCVRNNSGQRHPFTPFVRTVHGERTGKITVNGDRALLQLTPRPATIAMLNVRGAWYVLIALG